MKSDLSFDFKTEVLFKHAYIANYVIFSSLFYGKIYCDLARNKCYSKEQAK